MIYGTLRIRFPDGREETYTIEQPSILVGRATGNEVFLDNTSVSRRHARLTVESARMTVEDLGSANGSFVDGRRLSPNAPQLLTGKESLRLGDIEVKYLPPEEAGPKEQFQAPATSVLVSSAPPQQPARPSGPPVNISFTGPAQPVAPGSSGQAALTVQNRSAVVDELLIAVAGLPQDWVKLSRPSVSLLPGGQEVVTLLFQPPRRPEARAGDNPFTVTVTSRQYGHSASASGTLKILPFDNLSLALSPQRSRQKFNVQIQNRGNAPQVYDFAATDEEHGLNYGFQPPALTLPAGQSASAALDVTPKVKPRIGVREVRTFNVTATPRDPLLAPTTAAGQLLIRPPIPIWLIPLVLLLVLCLCGATVFGYLKLCPTYGLPLCPGAATPVVNFFTVTPAEVTAGGTAVLAWDVSNADQVEINPVPGTVQPSGNFSLNPQQNTIYTLRATNFAGSTEQSVELKVSGTAPAIQSFTVDPPTLVKGQVAEVVFSWVAPGADQVSISGVSGTFGATGSANAPAPAQTAAFTLTATNATGTVSQEISVTVIEASCQVANLNPGDQLQLREGPSTFYRVVNQLENGTQVTPLERNDTGEWLRVQAGDREGWAASTFISCPAEVDILAFPTLSAGSVPPAPATASATLPPTHAPTDTPVPTDTPTPTATPLFSGGYVVLKRGSPGSMTLSVVAPDGSRTRLVENVEDADVLDYTRTNGGKFALRVLSGGTHTLWIVKLNGEQILVNYNGGWSTITDGDWSPDGERLVVEGVTGGPTYFYFDGRGNLLNVPGFP